MGRRPSRGLVRVRPNATELTKNVSWPFAIKGDCEPNILDLTRAIELQARNASAYDIRGVAYLRKGPSIAQWQTWGRWGAVMRQILRTLLIFVAR